MKFNISIFIFSLLISCNKVGNSLNYNKLENVKVVEIEKPNFDKSTQMIDEEKYWEILNKSFLKYEKYESQKIALINQLLKLSPQEIVGFDLRTSKLLGKSYSSELWCAAYIMKGGCSDDGFEYFRCWLISKGKDIFYKALENPDSLSELKRKFFFDYELEEFLYLPNYAFKAKTGKEIYNYIDYEKFQKEQDGYKNFEFNWNEDDKESLKKICPKLYEKY